MKSFNNPTFLGASNHYRSICDQLMNCDFYLNDSKLTIPGWITSFVPFFFSKVNMVYNHCIGLSGLRLL